MLIIDPNAYRAGLAARRNAAVSHAAGFKIVRSSASKFGQPSPRNSVQALAGGHGGTQQRQQMDLQSIRWRIAFLGGVPDQGMELGIRHSEPDRREAALFIEPTVGAHCELNDVVAARNKSTQAVGIHICGERGLDRSVCKIDD